MEFGPSTAPNASQLKLMQTLKGSVGSILCVRFNKDGNYCLSGGADKKLRLWNPMKGTLIKTYEGHGHDIFDLDVSVDNSRVVSVGGDKLVFYWDVANGKILRRFRGHTSRINCVSFNADSGLIASGSYDRTVHLFDTKSQSQDPIQILKEAKDSVNSIAIDAHSIITGSIDGCIRNYDVRMGLLTEDQLPQAVTSVHISSDKNCILASCLDHSVRLIDRNDSSLLNTFSGHRNINYKIDSILTPDDSHVISGSEDNNVYVWDLVSAKLKTTLKGHTNAVLTVAHHPSTSAPPVLLSGSADSTIKVWTTSNNMMNNL